MRHDSAMESLANRLRKERARKGWSQEQLAMRAGVSATTIAELERDPNRGTKKLLQIARALNVNPTWLDTGKGPRHNHVAADSAFIVAESIEDLAEKIAELRPEDIGQLIQLIIEKTKIQNK